MNDFRDFDEMSRTIQNMGSKWKQASANGDKKNTYFAIHKRMLDLNEFLNNERSDMNDKISSMRETYTDKIVSAEQSKLTKEFNELANSLVEDCRKEINTLTDSKRENIVKMLSTPPTQEQLRLLEVLNMRADLSETELQNIVPMFFDNYNAIKVLQNIGQQNGITITLPVQLDARTMFDNVSSANAELSEACKFIAEPLQKIPLKYKAFFTRDPKSPDFIHDPDYVSYIEVIDGVPQLQDVKTKKTTLTPTEQRKIDYYFKDLSENASDGERLMKTEEVMKKHPEDIDILKVSDYKDYVAEVEESASNS